jgi:abortive infection bacteriophage resistance protein
MALSGQTKDELKRAYDPEQYQKNENYYTPKIRARMTRIDAPRHYYQRLCNHSKYLKLWLREPEFNPGTE